MLELPDVWAALDNAADGKPLPKAIERAWRDAGARNAYEFLQEQLEKYPYQLKPGDQEVLSKARKRLVSQAAAVDAVVAANVAQQSMPSLARLGAWVMDVTMGTQPVAAATWRSSGGGRDGNIPFTDEPAGDVGRFRRAILNKESGGNYSAVNRDSGALGVGQVMPYNVGPWTQKYLGRRLTPQQFLRDRAAQDAVVNGRFRDMLADQRKAGYRGEVAIRRAAAVWYSGRANKRNDTKPQYSNGRRYPSIAEYTKAIWQSYQGGG